MALGVVEKNKDFNPRPRKEGDIYKVARRVDVGISIHALAKRATNLTTRVAGVTIISIHALAKRATNKDILNDLTEVISIHALAKRATPKEPKPLFFSVFQSTPSQRGRLTGGDNKWLRG